MCVFVECVVSLQMERAENLFVAFKLVTGSDHLLSKFRAASTFGPFAHSEIVYHDEEGQWVRSSAVAWRLVIDGDFFRVVDGGTTCTFDQHDPRLPREGWKVLAMRATRAELVTISNICSSASDSPYSWPSFWASTFFPLLRRFRLTLPWHPAFTCSRLVTTALKEAAVGSHDHPAGSWRAAAAATEPFFVSSNSLFTMLERSSDTRLLR